MTLLVRDEADIIKENIEYHLSRGVDKIVVTDNSSVDGTTEILRDLESRGLIELFHESSLKFAQGAWVTRMARHLYDAHKVDWIMNLDADEFFRPIIQNQKEDIDLKEYFKKFDDDSVIEVCRQNMVLSTSEQDDSSVEWYKKLIYRDCNSRNKMGPKAFHRGASDVVIAEGNHAVQGTGLSNKIRDEESILYHFPVRSYDRFLRKTINGAESVMSNPELSEKIASHWKRRYNDISSDRFRKHFEVFAWPQDKLDESIKKGTVICDRTIEKYIDSEH